MRLLVVLIIFVIFTVRINEGTFLQPACVSSIITENNPTNLAELGKSTVERLSRSLLTGWSPNAMQLKNVLVTFIRSSKKAEVDLAMSLVPLSIVNPYLIFRPSACAFAKIINATVTLDNALDLSPIQNLINNVMEAYQKALVEMAIYTAKKVSGCFLALWTPYPTIPSDTCFNNGKTYQIDALWDTYGIKIPLNVRLMVKALYNSNNYKDNFIAAMVTYRLLPFSSNMNLSWSVQQGLEMINLQIEPYIRHQCCAARLCRLNELQQSNNAELGRIMVNQKKIFSTAPIYNNTCSVHQNNYDD